MRLFLLILLLSLAHLSFASTRDISDFAEPSGKYLVVPKQLSVSEGDTLLVASGLNVLFAPLTGITISDGTLIVQGTKDMPVTLTSVNDTSDTGTPFDWNGIEVTSSGNVRLSYCYIAHATSAITVPDSQAVTLNDCIFSNNGQWALSVAGVIVTVPELKPFSYGSPPENPRVGEPLTPVLDSTPTPLPPPSPLPPAPAPSNLRKSTLLLGALGLALTAAGTYSLYRGSQAKSEYNAYVPGNSSFDRATPSQRQNTFSDLRHESNVFSALGWASIALAAADGLFILWRVAF